MPSCPEKSPCPPIPGDEESRREWPVLESMARAYMFNPSRDEEPYRLIAKRPFQVGAVDGWGNANLEIRALEEAGSPSRPIEPVHVFEGRDTA